MAVAIMPPYAWQQDTLPGSPFASMQQFPLGSAGTPPTPPAMMAAPPWVSSSGRDTMLQKSSSPASPYGSLPPGSFSFSMESLPQPAPGGAPGNAYQSGMYSFPSNMGSFGPPSAGSFGPPGMGSFQLPGMGSFPPPGMGSFQSSMGSMRQSWSPAESIDPRMSPPFGSFNAPPQLGMQTESIVELPLKDEDRRLLAPVIHPPQPLVQCPMTLQYGFTAHDDFRREYGKDAIKGRPYCGWGQAVLRHAADTTFLDKLVSEELGTNLVWYFIESQGNMLNFWDKNFTDELYVHRDAGHEVHPVQFLDMRRAYTVDITADNSLSAVCKCEVNICFSNGRFTFKVRTKEEGQGWKKCIFRVIAENAQINAVKAELGYEAYLDGQFVGRGDVMMKRFLKKLHSTPAQREAIRDLMTECVRQFSKGMEPQSAIFEKIFNLYTQGDDMDLHKMEQLYKDMLEVRRDALRQAIIVEEKQLFTAHRSVFAGSVEAQRMRIENAKLLLAFFESKLSNPQKFMDEVVSFRAACDVTKDGIVNLREFMRAAPRFMLPLGQLKVEAAIIYPGERRASIW